jgi:uncharacterized glyoxalase superfamily protein PhnB
VGYISPTLAVRDMKKTIEFYTKSLGFTLGMTFPSADNPEYADLSKDGMVLMFIPTKELGIGSDEKLGTGVNLYMQIDGNIDAYYDELKKRGVKIAVDIKDEPFGIRDFTVEDVDGYKLTFNQVPQAAETCDSCEVPMLANCQSCGMPMRSAEEYGGGNTENAYCVHCCHPDGSLKSYDEVFEGMVGFMMGTRNMDRESAENATREYLATMPAWSGH